MGLSTILVLIVLTASSAIKCAKSYEPSEMCSCVPLNICPELSKFSKDDVKYFKTVLKCKEEGFIRCCRNKEAVNSASRRSDDDENIILTDELPSDKARKTSTNTFEDSLHSIDVEITTESVDLTTLDSERSLTDDATTTIENSDELFTTDSPEPEEISEEASESKRKSKFIDNNVEVVYANQNTAEMEKNKNIMEHLFLIFPNGEIEAALAMSSTTESPQFTNDAENLPIKPKRVIVRKRLIKKSSVDSLEGAESKISQAVIEPLPMDVEEVKKRLSVMLRNNRGRITHSSITAAPATKTSTAITTSSPTTEIPVEETTAIKQRRKKIKFRNQIRTSTVAPISTSTTSAMRREKVETSTMKSRRKIIYDARGRTNFLKRPSSQQIDFDDDEPIEPEVISTTTTTTTEISMRPAVKNVLFDTVFTTPAPRQLVKHFNRIDYEHKAMIETVHKTLSAIHSGVDIKFVEKMLESHKSRMKEIRQNPSSTFAASEPTRPYRGSATFRKPATVQPAQDEPKIQVGGTRTRNLSRTRNTATTHLTTHKSTRKAPRTFVTQPQANPIMNSNSLLEEVDMPPKQKQPVNFRASPLYGITMDKFNEFDGDMIEKIHGTLQSPPNTLRGFFPVIQNGTPSTLL